MTEDWQYISISAAPLNQEQLMPIIMSQNITNNTYFLLQKSNCSLEQ